MEQILSFMIIAFVLSLTLVIHGIYRHRHGSRLSQILMGLGAFLALISVMLILYAFGAL